MRADDGVKRAAEAAEGVDVKTRSRLERLARSWRAAAQSAARAIGSVAEGDAFGWRSVGAYMVSARQNLDVVRAVDVFALTADATGSVQASIAVYALGTPYFVHVDDDAVRLHGTVKPIAWPNDRLSWPHRGPTPLPPRSSEEAREAASVLMFMCGGV